MKLKERIQGWQEDRKLQDQFRKKGKRVFTAYFYFVEWHHFNLGLHIDFSLPNIEIHIPFGFIRIGWEKMYPNVAINHYSTDWRSFGLTDDFYRKS